MHVYLIVTTCEYLKHAAISSDQLLGTMCTFKGTAVTGHIMKAHGPVGAASCTHS